MDCSPPSSSVHGLFHTRLLEQVAISYSRGSSQHRGGTHASCVSCTALSLLVFSVCKRWLGEGRSLSVATEITVLFPFPAKVLLWTVTSEVTNSLRPAESFSLQIYSKRTAVLGARADGKYFRLASQMVSVLAMQPWHCSVKSATVNMWMNGCRCVPVKLYL